VNLSRDPKPSSRVPQDSLKVRKISSYTTIDFHYQWLNCSDEWCWITMYDVVGVYTNLSPKISKKFQESYVKRFVLTNGNKWCRMNDLRLSLGLSNYIRKSSIENLAWRSFPTDDDLTAVANINKCWEVSFHLVMDFFEAQSARSLFFQLLLVAYSRFVSISHQFVKYA